MSIDAFNRLLHPLSFLQVFLWVLMGLVLLVVCMSRVFMAAHFPHQVIAGLASGLSAPREENCSVDETGVCSFWWDFSGCLSGVLVAEVVSWQKWIYGASMRNYICTTVFLTSFAIGFYLLLKSVGVDLLWTIEKAQKWCVRPEWVHLDTTPLASLLRNMGTLLGLGLGLQSSQSKRIMKCSISSKTGSIAASLLLLQFLDRWTFSSDDLLTFYFLSFAKSAVALLIPTLLVPFALCCIFESKTNTKDL